MADHSTNGSGGGQAASESPALKLEKLIKVLGQTTSDNDNIATMAVRQANRLLESAGWTWERLLLGKVTIVADPFANLQAPPASVREPPQRQPSATKAYAPQWSMPPRPQRTYRIDMWCASCGTKSHTGDICCGTTVSLTAPPQRKRNLPQNKFPAHCWTCGDVVGPHCGGLTAPPRGASTRNSTFIVLCSQHATDFVNGKSLPTQRATRKGSLGTSPSSVTLDQL